VSTKSVYQSLVRLKIPTNCVPAAFAMVYLLRVDHKVWAKQIQTTTKVGGTRLVDRCIIKINILVWRHDRLNVIAAILL
jgi:hypothetical protein